MTNKRTKRIAIVTYNRVGNGQYPNGVINGKNAEVYFAQNRHLSKWAADPNLSDGQRQNIRRYASINAADSLSLEDMDHIFLYVGDSGGEEAIGMTVEIPGQKMTYVMCRCNYSAKKNRIRGIGRTNPRIISCECGGRETLEKIVRLVMNSTISQLGKLPEIENRL